MFETPPPATFEVINASQEDTKDSSLVLQDLFDVLQQKDTKFGVALENFLTSLPAGEQVTLSISLNGAGRFEVTLNAGENLDAILRKINSEFQTTARTMASEMAGISVNVNTSDAQRAINGAFREGTAQDLRELQVSIVGTAMGQSQSRTYQVVAFSIVANNSRISFSVLNPEGMIEELSVSRPDIVLESTAPVDQNDDEVTVLAGITIRQNEDFTYNGIKYRFSGINLRNGDPVIFSVNDRGGLSPLSESDAVLLSEITSIDQDGNLVLPLSQESSRLQTEDTEIIKINPDRGDTYFLELGDRFYIDGVSATFSIARSGNSYELILHRDDNTQLTVGQVVGARVNTTRRLNLTDAEDYARDILNNYSFTISGGRGNETVRIRR